MIASSHDHTALPDSGTLTTLRGLATEAPLSIDEALETADQQASLLRGMLTAEPLIETLAELVPCIHVHRATDIPVAALSFWANGRWCIHLRASDPIKLQSFTVLHQLKHIIDHPLREANRLSDIDREAVANHFANRVLHGDRHLVGTSRQREGSQ